MNEASPDATSEQHEELDPFGLDRLVINTTKKDEKSKGKKDPLTRSSKDAEENARFLKSQREALISCLEIAAKRYKTPWSDEFLVISLVALLYGDLYGFTFSGAKHRLTSYQNTLLIIFQDSQPTFCWRECGDRLAQQWLGLVDAPHIRHF